MYDRRLEVSITLNILLVIVIAIILVIIAPRIIKIEKKEEVKEQKIDYKKENIVFLGDSITDWYPFDQFFDNEIPIVNSGFAGKDTKYILDNLEDFVYVYNPTKVFILIGTNDLNNEEYDIDEIINNIETITKKIQKNRPYTKIYLESIYPISHEKEAEENRAGYRDNKIIRKINKILKEYAKENKITYIDMYSILKDDNNNLKDEYTEDGLHISIEGYSAISKELEKFIEEIE